MKNINLRDTLGPELWSQKIVCSTCGGVDIEMTKLRNQPRLGRIEIVMECGLGHAHTLTLAQRRPGEMTRDEMFAAFTMGRAGA